MSLWELTSGSITEVAHTTFREQSISERGDLQAALRDHITVLGPDLFVLDEEFSNWDESARRIDLLCIDRLANIVVVELKRDETGGHAELQAIRYAAMVSSLTFEQAVDSHAAYLRRREIEGDAEALLLKFLDWTDADAGPFGQDVRILLGAADFSKELTSAVLWLRDRQVDIRCIRLVPYQLQGTDGTPRVLLNVEQLIPVPEASDMMMRIAEKAQRQREAVRSSARDYRRFDVCAFGEERLSMAKGPAAHFLVKAAIERGGISAADVNALSEQHPREWYTPLLRGFPGEIASTNFDELLAAEAENLPRRYRTSDGELIHSGGSTWAFTNQWSGVAVESLVAALRSGFPGLDIDYAVSSEN